MHRTFVQCDIRLQSRDKAAVPSDIPVSVQRDKLTFVQHDTRLLSRDYHVAFT